MQNPIINDSDTLSKTEFKRLIYEIWEHSRQTRVRFRVLGKMWDTRFLTITHITNSDAIIVQDRDQIRYVSMNDVVMFELENKVREYKPNYHYKVDSQ